jgi:membrane protein involved in colicin uptake
MEKLRAHYETALKQRKEAGQNASNKKAARDTAKEDYLDVYAQVAARVKAEFPRDRAMQDLFFDTVSDAGSPIEESGTDEDDIGDTGSAGDAPGGPAGGGESPA